jgi:hypothetical protein
LDAAANKEGENEFMSFKETSADIVVNVHGDYIEKCL